MNPGAFARERQAESISEVLDSRLQDLTQLLRRIQPQSRAQIALRIDCFAVHSDFVV
jgi:hypothetical protein